MKEYEIWLKSGDSLVGEVEDGVAAALRREFKQCKNNMVRPLTHVIEQAWPYAFKDTDGVVDVDLVQVAMMNIREVKEKGPTGFVSDREILDSIVGSGDDADK